MMPIRGGIPQRAIDIVLREHGPRLMSLPGVVSAAQGLCDGRPCIRVLVVNKTKELLERIPSNIEGHRVIVDESGKVRVLESK